MGGKSNNSSIILTQSAPDTKGTARVDLRKRDFDALIWGKSYEVYIDKAIKCPCRNVKDGQALSACKNCGGSGWLYINRRESRSTLQSMNVDTKFKEWSQEMVGTAKMSFLNKESLQYMDRVTIRNAVIGTQQNVICTQIEQSLRARTIYPIKEVEEIFLFESTDKPLIKLEVDVDYTIENNNWIKLDDKYVNTEHPTISIRYNHNPQYHILELTRATMTSIEKRDGVDVDSAMPLSAMVRLCHYVIDEQNFTNNFLLDNSYQNDCE